MKKYDLLLSKLNDVNKVRFKDYIATNWHSASLFYLYYGEITENKRKEASNSKSLDRFLLGRNLEKYVDNIISGWLVEDFLNLFIFNGKMLKTGSDCHRELLFGDMFEKVGPSFDGMYKNTQIDIMADWTGYCKNNGSISMNFEKYNKMVREEAILYIYDVYNNNIIKLDVKNDIYKNVEVERNVKHIGKKYYINECYFNYDDHILRRV